MTAVLIIGAGADDLQHGSELDQATVEVASALKKHGLETILLSDNPFSYALDDDRVIDHPVVAPLGVKQVVALINRFEQTMIIQTQGSRNAFELVHAVSEKGIFQEGGLNE